MPKKCRKRLTQRKGISISGKATRRAETRIKKMKTGKPTPTDALDIMLPVLEPLLPHPAKHNKEIKMATVEQCETQPTGLGTLSSTLDLFDSYKPLPEEEKDSDEESFHLPMLDCDDDLESNNKEPIKNGIEKEVHDETEDDILNKFESTATPDLDPKIEDSILEDIEELSEKKPTEENTKINPYEEATSQEKQCGDNKEITLSTKEEDNKSTDCNDKLAEAEDSINSELKDIADEVKNKIEKYKNGDKKEPENTEAIVEKIIAHDIEIIQKDEPKQNNKNLEKSSIEYIETERESEDKTIGNNIDDSIEEELLVESNEGPKDKNEEISVNAETVDTEDEKTNATIDEDKKTEQESTEKVGSVGEEQEVEKSAADSENMDVDSVEQEIEPSEINISVDKQENSQDISEITATDNDIRGDILNEDHSKLSSEPMEIENLDKEKEGDILKATENASENTEATNKKDVSDEDSIDQQKPQDDKLNKDSTLCEIRDGKEINKDIEKCDMEKPLEQTTLAEPNKQTETVVIEDTVVPDDCKSEKTGPDKCENSNDSSKSQNLECDDLLDISIIRDVDEDNASAIAENANDAHSSEKSDNDDQDEGSEKAENELDESEMDQEESLLITDKDDNMDFEEGNSSNLGDQENAFSGGTSDSETKEDVEMRDSENDSKESNSVLKEKTKKTVVNETNSEKSQTDKPKDVGSEAPVVAENQEPAKENSVKVNGKRSLSETDKDIEVIKKKPKLSGHSSTEEKKSTKNNKAKTLVSFEKYMQNKKLKNKLSRSDLEQFCLQKICEAIMHKTDVGELHQTIKKQELIIENLRKDLQQLTKQTRDLDIVNKKLMNELKAQNINKKPLVPLKITRSVGLQVKLNLNADNNPRRKIPVTPTPRTPSTPATNTNANTNANATVRPRTIAPANTSVVRQVAASPRKSPTSTPLLSQALQNRQATPANTAKRTPIRPKPAEPQKPANQNVIVDLTDEDDKAAKTVGTPVKILNKTITQAKTINIVQTKSVPNKTINNNQTKTVAVGQVKTTMAKVGTPTRTVTTLPQGVRLTPTQVKNGSITLPASVVTSSTGTTQLMYVVQPTSSLGQVVTSTASGTQKAVLLNFQPTNGVLTSTLNGSAVSVIPTKTTNTVQLKTVAAPKKHPAPLPTPPPITVNAALKPLLPKPHLSIRKTDTGIILQWRMPYNLEVYEGIASYQLFAYQETNAAPSTDMWRKVGDVKALALPMACTLTQFADKNKYYFAVRSVDVHKRIGAFSDPEEISL